jgi:hypothetical protein
MTTAEATTSEETIRISSDPHTTITVPEAIAKIIPAQNTSGVEWYIESSYPLVCESTALKAMMLRPKNEIASKSLDT